MKTAKVTDYYNQVIEMIGNNATHSLKMYLLLIKATPEEFKSLRSLLEESGIILTAILVTGRKVVSSKKRSENPVDELETEEERYADAPEENGNTYSLYMTHRGSTSMVGVAGKESWFSERGFVFI